MSENPIQELFERSVQNPILAAKDLPGDFQSVINPAAHIVGDDVLLLLRVVDKGGHSHLTVARSQDGVGNWRIEPTPLLAPEDGFWYDNLGCEDPRLTFVPERNEYVITYVGWSRYGAGVCLATTRDFRTVERLGMVIHPYNKDAALFPRRIRGRYQLLHRPTAGPLENIWIADSEDLIHWGNPCCVLEECDQPGWDSGKVGTGPTPVETPDGWLLIFHGVQQVADGWVYRVGLALLELENPTKVIARTANWVFGPTLPYEMSGSKPGIVFPTGAIIREGIVYLYYGAADTSVALATAPLDRLLKSLEAS